MKFENTRVYNFENAFRGMRNPMNSWNKSDSEFAVSEKDLFDGFSFVADKWVQSTYPKLGWPEHFSDTACLLAEAYRNRLEHEGTIYLKDNVGEFAAIGPKDMKLAQSLIKGGSEHRKFLRQIFVSVDITAPLYFFKELDTYKVATTANSTSTMHKLTSKPITIDCFEIDDMNNDLDYFQGNTVEMLSDVIIEQLEYLRQKYVKTKDKRYWKELVRWLPEGWLQTRTWTASYETIRAMCQQRRSHKLNEWSGLEHDSENFIDWARTLPYSQWLIFDDENISFSFEK